MTPSARLLGLKTPQRRVSGLSERLSADKLTAIRSLSPAKRLMLALELSDTCHELQRACSPKH